MRVPRLVVVPTDDLEKAVVEFDASIGVVDAAVGIAEEIAGNDRILGIAQHTRHRTFGRGPHRGVDRVETRRLLRLERQIDHRHVRSRNPERHSRELALDRREAECHRLGCTRAGGNDVHVRIASASHVLLRRAVLRRLRRSRGMNRRHQSFCKSEGIEDDLGDGGQAVGCA